MSTTIAVQKIPDATQRTEPVFAAIDRLLDDVRSRAYELFAQRGSHERSAQDDWLEAERQIAWPAAELVEDDAGYRLEVALPGYCPQEIGVTVTPQEIIVSAASEQQTGGKPVRPGAGVVRWSEFRSDRVCRRIELPGAIDTNQVTAALENGLLTVKAAKQAQAHAESTALAAAA